MRDADRIDTTRPRWRTFRHRWAPLSLGAGLALLLLVGGCQPGDPGAGSEAGSEAGVASGTASAFVEAGGAFPDGWPFAAEDAPVTAAEGMVASTDEYASRVGVEILAAGGNAVDAAVATGLALAVVNPEAGNLGGGGFMMIRLADGTVFAQDHREKAPMAATRDMYLAEGGNVTDLSVRGHLAAGVPGTVSGLWEAHRRFGALEWTDVVQPSIDLAHGFEVTTRLVSTLDAAQEGIRAFPHSARIFLPGDAVPGIGDTFAQPDLAAVLTRLRDQGPDDFYRGETAALIVAEMERGGGASSRWRTSTATKPCGGSRSPSTTAATRCTRCRRRPRAASRWRPSPTSSSAGTWARWGGTAPRRST